MAKSKRRTKQASRQSDWQPADVWADLRGSAARHKWWALIIVIVPSYLLFRQVEMRIQKAEFKRAEHHVRETISKLEQSINMEHSRKDEQHCYYTARKFNTPIRGCFVGSTLHYKVLNPEQANEILKVFATVNGGGKLYEHPSWKGEGFKDNIGEQRTSQDIANTYLDECSMEYTYFTISHESRDAQPGDLIVRRYCKGAALAEYYPVTE